jgi:hypothetical protein
MLVATDVAALMLITLRSELPITDEMKLTITVQSYWCCW